MSHSSTMRCALLSSPGPPSALHLTTVPIPTPTSSQILIRIHAFGLNRSELFTRQGHSPSVAFPRILGIECVGTIVFASCSITHTFPEGATVATCMGGMGRVFDGGYAEYVVVPASQVQIIPETRLDWAQLGALPEMVQTAWGSLHRALRIKRGDRLLIRGCTTSVGLAAMAIAKREGCWVAATTRKEGRAGWLKEMGADEVFVDQGGISEEVGSKVEGRFDKVLELVGTTTLEDSLRCAGEGAVVCMTGIAGGEWEMKRFRPMESIPTGVSLTAYSGGVDDFMRTPLGEIVKLVEEGKLKIPVRTFKLDEIVEAHRVMEEEGAAGKMVVLT